MKTITFFNNKGGVGKTTTIINLASYLSIKKEKKVLILDLDPQANSTQAILKEEIWSKYYGIKAQEKTIFNYFEKIEEGDSEFVFYPIPIGVSDNNYKVSLIPGHPKLSLIDDAMSKSWSEARGGEKGALRKQNWLNQLKVKVSNDYDYMFIDVGPSLGALNRSALLNSDYFITPMASDIFSLLGISNIGEWISDWEDLYNVSLTSFRSQNKTSYTNFFQKNLINDNPSVSTKFLGYSIQQYSKRKFKSGERPTQAFENVIKDFHAEIVESLGPISKEGLNDIDLKLGDIPYVYSIIPLSQTSNTPIFELSYADGLRGNQTSSVEAYKKYIEILANNFLRNVGDINV